MEFFEYSFNGVPIFTYGMIGITTFVLATITFYESVNSNDESILSKLPNITPTPTFLNPTKEEPRMFNQGGQTKNKKKKNNKTKKMI